MKRYLLIISLFIVGFSINDVQTEYITINWKRNVNTDKLLTTKFDYTFENASLDFDNTGLPFYYKNYNLVSSNQDFRLVIENAEFEEYTSGLEISEFINLQNEIQIETFRLKSGQSESIEVKIIPIIKRDGKILLLNKFNLKKIPVRYNSLKTAEHNWATQSVLSSGKWVKIKTSGKGIYKIPYSKLTGWGFSNPSQVNVFGSGGTILSENPGEIEFDDLKQSSVWHAQNNGTDCLFFYEPGNIDWSPDNSGEFFEHQNHNYSNNGFFFLSDNVGSAKTVQHYEEVTEGATHSISNFDAYKLYEKETFNLIYSGKQWFGEKFGYSATHSFNFELQEIENTSEVSIKVNSAARSYQTSKMQVYANSNYLGLLDFYNVDTDEPTDDYADEQDSRFSIFAESENLEVELKYAPSNDNALAWLDFIEINYRKKLVLDDEALFFRDLNSVGDENIVEFSIESNSSAIQLFNVTNVNNVMEVPLQFSENVASAKRPANKLYEYVAFNANGTFPEPEFVVDIENQNLHGLATPEYLIITHPNFLEEANELASFHESYDGLSSEVVTTDKIYNEFSSGSYNATGIRNFIKMFYDRGNTLKYVLLFGDGSYDNKNINAENLNFIPTYQSKNSLDPIGSFVTDDYFVLLDENESVYNGAVDLGIGRIPASTIYQAELVVDKIKRYNSEDALGNWRNVISFIGDDEDGNTHMWDSERLANLVNENHSEFLTHKIYFDAFKQESTTSGETYPDVTEAIDNRVEEGVLILNYVGHANERYLADERVLDVSNINSWSNTNKLPIFVTATCEFSRFDADETSAGEYVLFNANGGGIGLFSTTRLVISGPNYLLSRSFYNHVFERDENGNHYRMGDIMRLAKINTSNSTNKRNFSLLTDPALKLSYPKNKIITTSINQQSATNNPDTIGALQTIIISGYVADYSGSKLNNFSGEIIPTVYDKGITMNTLGNSGETPMEFKVQENVIYKGVASVKNGDFSFSFVVPKDISYNLGKGKILYYADNGEEDANGAFENFVIGGAGSEISDNQGPQINLFMDSEQFVSGGKTSKNPTLLAFLSDENGINTAGTGIGHDITAIIDNDYSEVFVLNNYYQANIDDYTSGVLTYPLKNLTPGTHSLKLKAWDVANNSTEVEIEFEVTSDFVISEVNCYPNPVNDYTNFVFNHNQSGATLEVIVEIFNQQGSRIDYFTTEVGSGSTTSNPIRWDLGELGILLRNGMYIYRITAKNNDGLITSKSGKMVVLN